MSGTCQHWIATDAGSARPGNEDAYLWLGSDDTGGNGELWLVVDGEGGPGVGNLAAAMVTVTVGELYAELIDLHGDPVLALEIALREADSRLESIGKVYPRLVGVRASYAALASYQGKLYPVVAGTGCVLAIRHGQAERIGAPDVKRHARSADDLDPVPGTGVGIYGAVRQPAVEPFDPDHVTVFLCTDGITEMVPDELIAQAVERLAPKDAVETLIELARRRWSDDDATAALVRFVDTDFQAHTTGEDFLDWAESGMTKWPDKTLMLRVGPPQMTEPPPRTNVDGLPPIVGEEVAEDADEAIIRHTMTFSAEQVRAIVDASGASAAVAEAEPPPEPAAEVAVASDDAGEASASGAEAEEEPTSEGSEPAPGAPGNPVTSAGGTFFFSPQQMAQVRAAAEEAERAARAGDDAAAGEPPGPPPVEAPVPEGDDSEPPSTRPFATPNPTTEPLAEGPPVTAEAPSHTGPGPLVDRTADLDQDAGAEVPRTAEFSSVPSRAPRDVTVDDVATVQRGQLTNAELRARSGVSFAVLLLVAAAVAVGIGMWFALR